MKRWGFLSVVTAIKLITPEKKLDHASLEDLSASFHAVKFWGAVNDIDAAVEIDLELLEAAATTASKLRPIAAQAKELALLQPESDARKFDINLLLFHVSSQAGKLLKAANRLDGSEKKKKVLKVIAGELKNLQTSLVAIADVIKKPNTQDSDPEDAFVEIEGLLNFQAVNPWWSEFWIVGSLLAFMLVTGGFVLSFFLGRMSAEGCSQCLDVRGSQETEISGCPGSISRRTHKEN